MNIKRLLGTILTVLGIAGVIYATLVFSKTGGDTSDVKALIIFGMLALILFFSGIGLVKTVNDVA